MRDDVLRQLGSKQSSNPSPRTEARNTRRERTSQAKAIASRTIRGRCPPRPAEHALHQSGRDPDDQGAGSSQEHEADEVRLHAVSRRAD